MDLEAFKERYNAHKPNFKLNEDDKFDIKEIASYIDFLLGDNKGSQLTLCFQPDKDNADLKYIGFEIILKDGFDFKFITVNNTKTNESSITEIEETKNVTH